MFIEVKLKPLVTPDRVKVDGAGRTRTYALADLTPETISDLCDAYRAEMFAKAGKNDPKLPQKRATE